MQEITVLSGKGGTGKTSITAGLASLAQQAVFCDNDVDAADLHLILHPDVQEEHRFVSGQLAHINPAVCTACGLCASLCRFDAVHASADGKFAIDPLSCEGCRLCERQCPVQAIHTQSIDDNFWYVSATRFGPLVHAEMGPGEENSGKLVAQVRSVAKELAKEKGCNYVLNDGPPGIGCAAISSITGTDKVLLVTEPSLSGLHDAKRLVELVQSFQIPLYVVINKFDLNTLVGQQMEDFFASENIPVLARIPYKEEVVEALVAGKSIVEYKEESPVSEALKLIWNRLAQV